MLSPAHWMSAAAVVLFSMPQLAHAGGGKGRGQGMAAPGAVKASSAADVEFGQAIRFHNISIVPVTTRDEGPFQNYVLLEEGLKGGSLKVRELDGNSSAASVNEVEVNNKGGVPVYLVGGEMILGGKQDRIIAQDTVVEPRSGWTTVSVYCVEQGRWSGQKMKFETSSGIADISIQKAAMSGSQSNVWTEVQRKNAMHGTQNATQTYRRTAQNEKLRRKIKPYVSELRTRLPKVENLAGVVFGINGRIHVADIFGNPELFEQVSGKLLSAYVLEALGHQVDEDAEALRPEDAASFIGTARKAKAGKSKKAGRARSYGKESDAMIGTETVDEGTGKTVRESYHYK